MGEPQEKMPKSLELLLQDTELLRKLWDEGENSGPPAPFDFDLFLRMAEEGKRQESSET